MRSVASWSTQQTPVRTRLGVCFLFFGGVLFWSLSIWSVLKIGSGVTCVGREEVSPPLLHPKAHPLPRVIKGVGLGVGVQPAFTSATPILRGIPLRCTGMGKLPRGC